MLRSLLKNKILVIVGIQLLFLWPLFQSGIFHTHDGVLHIARTAAYFEELTRGQFPVRWAGDLNYGYGSPLFIFYYPLPYVLGSFLHFIGLNFTVAFKILLGLSFIGAPVTFYLWIKKLFPKNIAFAAALVYGLAPYHFLDLYVRGAIGEMFAFIFIPLVLLSIESSTILLGAIFYGLLLLSHNAFGLLFTGIFILYGFLSQKIRATLVSIVLGLGLSAFFWLPAMIEQKFTHSALFISNKYLENFPTLIQLFWSPWGFGTEVAKTGALSPQIGPIFILLALASIFVASKKLRWFFVFSWILLLISVFFSLNISSFIWDKVLFLKKFEFPWRFSALASFAVAMLSAFVFSKKNARLLIILLFITSIPFIKTAGSDTQSDDYYLSYSSSTEFGAASTIWSAGDPFGAPKEPVQIIAGTGIVSNVEMSSTLHQFNVTADNDVTVLDNTLYFPGWKATIDNQKIPIEFQDANYRGLITFPVSQGLHKVEVRFSESPIRMIANVISVISLVFIIVRVRMKKI